MALAACGGNETATRPEVGSESSIAPIVEERPRVAPHSGAIERIAVTDDGKAAYTIDTFGQARLWLSLDGTREPVIARGGRAVQVALGRTDDGFVAALLDQAGGIELVRFDRDGRTRGHASLAPEPGFVEVRAAGGGMLARRRDEVLVWYDAGGHARGQIAPDPGERIAGLAVRRGRAIAALVSGERTAIALRWVAIDKALAWGARVTLTGAVEAPIALSPDGTKIAAIDTATKRYQVIDLQTGDAIFAKSDDSTALAESPSMGFLDDNTAVFSDVRRTVWWALATKDPWATSQRGTPSETSDVAIGDRVMLDASSTSITITTDVSMKYLGYRDIGPSVLWSMRDGVATRRGSKSVWLDRELHERISHVAASAQVDAIVGDHHMVVSDEGRIYVVDAETSEEATLGTYREAATVTYEPASSIVFVTTSSGVDRFQLALSPLRATRLPSLDITGSFGQVLAMDPKTSGGIVAMLSTHMIDGSLRLDWYREAAEPVAKIARTASTTIEKESFPLGADRHGVVYFLDRMEWKLVMIQLGTPNRTTRLVDDITTAAPHPDGTLVVVATASELVALDTATGEERWKLAVPGIDTLTFTTDGATLFASAQGGMVSIEPRNGTRIATACGWSFGLHDDQVSAQVFGVPNLCAGLE
ncbi:MAG: hypothetical protein AB7T06_26325 [Kofleriaceae bacterium]